MRLLIFVLILLGPNLAASKVQTAGKVKKNANNNDYCNVRDPTFSSPFNFNNLTNNNEDYIVKHEEGDYLTLQLCTSLKKDCDGKQGYAICHSRAGKEYGIGKEPPVVKNEFGEIMFEYTGDKCDNSHNFTVNIKMICDYAVKEKNDIEWFPSGYNDCNFNIEWRTAVACTERKQLACAVNDTSGHRYNLSPLINLSDNYRVYINETYSIILNVCHSVLFRPNACISHSGACLMNKKDNTSKSLGSPSEELEYNLDGSLTLTYKDGFICNQPGGPYQQSTTLTFICNPNVTGTLPKYNGGMEKCHYNISWETAYACSLEDLVKKSAKEDVEICTLRDPRTKYMYNLTSLMNRDIAVKPFGVTEVYKFRICAPLSDSKCKSGSGTCRNRGSLSGGMANSKLMLKESGLYLNYTNGDLCKAVEHQQMYTVLEFYCGEDGDYAIEERSELCHEVIKISTKYACDMSRTTKIVTTVPTESTINRVTVDSCTIMDSQLSLQQLSLESKNYVVKADDDTEYHINICKTLVNAESLNCPDSAAVCKVKKVNGKMTNTNLGKSGAIPMKTSDKSALLLYRDGSICEENKNKKLETSLSFLCDVNSELGSPVFHAYEDCTYKFNWKTSIVCGKIDGNLNNDCTISNSLGDVRSLSMLNELLGPEYQITSSKSDKKYYITLCAENTHCNGYVCDGKKSFGTKVKVLYDYAVNAVRFHFTDGSKCSSGSNAEAKITLICKKDRDQNVPVVLKESSDCLVEFQWQTSRICQSLSKTSLASSGSLTGGEVVAIVVSIFIIVLVLCYLLVARRSMIMECISDSSSRNCDRVKYSRVNTTEEVHLLMNATDPTVIETDSDDDLLE